MKAFPRAKISVMTLSKFRGPSLTDQGVRLVCFFNQTHPVAPEGLGRKHRLQHGGDRLHFLPLALSAPDRVGVGAVLADFFIKVERLGSQSLQSGPVV
jgi:hypothetical protein